MAAFVQKLAEKSVFAVMISSAIGINILLAWLCSSKQRDQS
jgi:hypothetical protein